MSPILLLATFLVAAPNGVQSLSPAQSPHARSTEGIAASSHRGVRNLDQAVRGEIRRFDRAEQPSREELVPELVSLYSDLTNDTQLKPRRRNRLVRLVRRRLRETEGALVRRLQHDGNADPSGHTEAHSLRSRSVKTRSHTAVDSRSKLSAVLAQRAGGAQPGGAARGGGGVGQPVNSQGWALVDLIRTTIAPKTWDVNGGKGSIYYYRPVHALVVRQTSEVHPQVGRLLGQLRR